MRNFLKGILYLPDRDDQWKDNKDTKSFYEVDDVGFSPYRQYLGSKQWKSKRKRKLGCAGYACESCGVTHKKGVTLDVHHKTYKRVTKERMSDLQVLCRKCHKRKHGGR